MPRPERAHLQAAAVKRFAKEYPWVKTYGAWNEANHVSQPTAKNPKLAAKYFLAAAQRVPLVQHRRRRRARLEGDADLAGQVQAQRQGQGADLRPAQLHGREPQELGEHPPDARNAPGEVWLTETGGILKFLPSFPRSESRQANRTKYMFKLADTYDRRRSGLRGHITRLYNYQWTGVEKSARFDAGLVNPDGTPRKAYRQFKKSAAKFAR